MELGRTTNSRWSHFSPRFAFTTAIGTNYLSVCEAQRLFQQQMVPEGLPQYVNKVVIYPKRGRAEFPWLPVKLKRVVEVWVAGVNKIKILVSLNLMGQESEGRRSLMWIQKLQQGGKS